MPEEKYRLWSFLVAQRTLIIARGRTKQEAIDWLREKIRRKVYLSNVEVQALPLNLTNTAKFYTTNHPFDWLNIPPGHMGIRPVESSGRRMARVSF